MKGSWHLYLTDLKNVTTNWVAAILIGGLMILPSLYAWMNIEASWDPYSKTDSIKVGVVNEDIGANIRDEEIRVGNELVNSLKENKSMDWQFVDKEKAMDELEYGEYFSVIVIPENFSENLSTVISDQPKKAEVEYFVNEKINAITPKITEKGASVIVEEISSNFVSTVNGVIFDIFNDLGIELESSLPDIKNFENYIFKIEKELPEIKEMLDTTLEDAGNAQGMLNDAKQLIPQVEEATNKGLNTVNDTLQVIQKAEKRLDEISPRVHKDLEVIQQTITDTNEFLEQVDLSNIDVTSVNQRIDTWNKQIDDTVATIETVEEILQQTQSEQEPTPSEDESQTPNNQENIEQALQQLKTMKINLQTVQKELEELDDIVAENQQEVKERLATIQEKAQFTNEKLDVFVKEYTENIEPHVREEINNAKSTLQSAKEIIVDMQSTIPEVNRMLSNTGANLTDGKDMLETVLGEFPYVNSKVKDIADRIRNIQGETDLQEIIELLQNDPEAERSFFEEPVMLSENKIFPIENYGTGMTPFYTILAIWVGGLLLISLLSTEPHASERFTGRSIYFGRLLTFITIGFCQTIIVTGGDIFLLGVEIAEPLWFVIFGLLASLIFMLIVYTLVSVLGDVGKAIAIVFLVLQIAGAGGTYPVDLLPDFFQVINPFLPFTYAINLMREAVGGIVWQRVLHDSLMLTSFGIVALVIGLLFKERLHKHTHKLMKKSRETGLFH